MELTVNRKVDIQLALTEEEVHVISGGLYALLHFFPFGNFNGYGDVGHAAMETKIEERFKEAAKSLLERFAASDLQAPEVTRAVEEGRRIKAAVLEEDRQRAEDDARAADSRRKLLARYGLQGMSPETENVLTYLLYVAPRCDGRWVTMQRFLQTYHYCGSGHDSMGQKIALVTPHLEFLEQRGRITLEEREGRRGWIVPRTKDFRAAFDDAKKS